MAEYNSKMKNIYDMLGISYTATREDVLNQYTTFIAVNKLPYEQVRVIADEFTKFFKMDKKEYDDQMESTFGKEFDKQTKEAIDLVNNNFLKNAINDFNQTSIRHEQPKESIDDIYNNEYKDSNGKRKFKLTRKQILAGALATIMLISAAGVAIHHFTSNNEITSVSNEQKEEKMSFRYLIKKGDTIWELKSRFHTDTINDKDGNSLKNDSFINEGNTLLITVSSNDFNIYDLVKEAEEDYKEGKTFTSEEEFANMEFEDTVKSR